MVDVETVNIGGYYDVESGCIDIVTAYKDIIGTEYNANAEAFLTQTSLYHPIRSRQVAAVALAFAEYIGEMENDD